MPREVVIVDYCDECFSADIRREAVATYTLGVDGKWLTLLACEDHGANVQYVIDLMVLHGKTGEKKQRNPRRGGTGRPTIYPDDVPMDCPLPGCDRHHANRRAWRQHLKQFHHMTIAQMHEQYPEVAA